MPVVKFVKENKEIEVPKGANLRKEAIHAGINVHQGINGFGAGINKFVNCHGIENGHRTRGVLLLATRLLRRASSRPFMNTPHNDGPATKESLVQILDCR